MHRILYTRDHIRRELGRIFAKNGRRVAVVAFVGKDAADLVGNPDGLEVVCWPRAGGTNPDGVRELIHKGADVHFSDGLHMKLYWSEKGGCIITSANLSSNALGAGSLREIGILVDRDRVDIDRVLRAIPRRDVTTKEMHDLDRAHDAFLARSSGLRKGSRSGHKKRQALSFRRWYESAHRRAWKLGWCVDYGPISEAAKSTARTEYGVGPEHSMDAKRGQLAPEDWMLHFRLDGDRAYEIGWGHLDFVIKVPATDRHFDPDYPDEGVQVHTLGKRVPPFRLDKKLKKAFKAAVAEYGGERIMALRSLKPSPYFLRLVHRHYRTRT